MKAKQVPSWLALLLITAVAGLLLGFTNRMTKDRIDAMQKAEQNASRQAVLADAADFEQQELAEDSGIDSLYAGLKDGEVIGYAAQVTVSGYGGPVEIMVGIDNSGTLTGITVGGANFAETAGLGEKAKDPAFTDQFMGKTVPVAIGDNIDAITGATITSSAVVSGVNKAAGVAGELAGFDAGVEEPASAVDESAADVLETTFQGFGGPVVVTVGVDADGKITGVDIGGPDFAETPGLGERVKEADFRDQFIGQSAPVSVDTIAGATITSQGVVDAVNELLGG